MTPFAVNPIKHIEGLTITKHTNCLECALGIAKMTIIMKSDIRDIKYEDIDRQLVGCSMCQLVRSMLDGGRFDFSALGGRGTMLEPDLDIPRGTGLFRSTWLPTL